MTKQALLEKLFQYCAERKITINKSGLNRLTSQTFKLVCNEALNNGRFSFPGFGTFRVVATPERRARNPKTSAVMTVPASHRIGFRASSDLKKNLRALEQNKFPKKEKKPKE